MIQILSNHLMKKKIIKIYLKAYYMKKMKKKN